MDSRRALVSFLAAFPPLKILWDAFITKAIEFKIFPVMSYECVFAIVALARFGLFSAYEYYVISC